MTVQQPMFYSEPRRSTQLRFESMIRQLTLVLIIATDTNPESTELVSIIGAGTERDNIRAMQTWVRKRLCCLSCARTVTPKELYADLCFILTQERCQ